MSIATPMVPINFANSLRSHFILQIPPSDCESWESGSGSAPAHGIDRAHRQENEKYDKAGVINQAGSIDNAPGEVLVMPYHRKIMKHGAHHAVGIAAENVDHPDE